MWTKYHCNYNLVDGGSVAPTSISPQHSRYIRTWTATSGKLKVGHAASRVRFIARSAVTRVPFTVRPVESAFVFYINFESQFTGILSQSSSHFICYFLLLCLCFLVLLRHIFFTILYSVSRSRPKETHSYRFSSSRLCFVGDQHFDLYDGISMAVRPFCGILRSFVFGVCLATCIVHWYLVE